MMMKSFKLVSIIVLSVVFGSVISCKDEPLDDELLNTDPDKAFNFQADFDGKTYKADAAKASIKTGLITISGLRGENGEAIVLTLQGEKEGSYALGKTTDGKTSTIAYNEPGTAGAVNWVSLTDGKEQQGTATITKIDGLNKKISGNFVFTGTNKDGDKKQFTNGIFTNISFEGEPTDVSNEFFAKLDGEEFKYVSVDSEISGEGENRGIRIIAVKDNIESIVLLFPEDVEVGEGTFTKSTVPPSGQYVTSNKGTYLGEGKFTIEKHDKLNKRLKGKFSFTGKLDGDDQTKAITEGSFDSYYAK